MISHYSPVNYSLTAGYFGDDPMMPYNDPNYLTRYQYQDSRNLNARIQIHKLFSTGTQDWNDFIFEHLNIMAGMRVLALGCGNATQWQVNQQRFPATAQVILTDLSFGMVQEAQAALGGQPMFAALCQDAQNLAFGSQTFDLVTANHMLYHVPTPVRALAEAARLLKPSGRLMAATNGNGHLKELDSLLREFDPGYQPESSMHAAFSLENGMLQIKPYFGEVEVIKYPSDLWVTDAALLSDYAFSTPNVKERFPADQQPGLTRFFQSRIVRDGGIFIKKETGIFLAARPAVHG
ncbi:MAG: class I SAM-dependent methyltransferase [Anaerolineaceae bacterium]